MKYILLLILLLVPATAPAQSITINTSSGGLGWRTDMGTGPDVAVPMTWTVPYYAAFL